VTALDTRRVDLTFSISYDDDIEKAQRVIEGVAKRHPLVLDDPEPMIRMNELAASSVNFVARPWVKKENYWTVLCDVTQQVKQAFDANGISIPFPQQDIHVRGVGQLAART
jgi:small conductance mechanosensitive channel